MQSVNFPFLANKDALVVVQEFNAVNNPPTPSFNQVYLAFHAFQANVRDLFVTMFLLSLLALIPALFSLLISGAA